MISFYHSKPDIFESVSLADHGSFFIQTENNWILQTFLALRSIGMDVRISDDLTSDGVLIGCSVRGDFRPGPSQYFVCVVADGAPHRWADMFVVQNAVQARWLPGSIFVPHWPQPGIIHRDSQRGDRIENVVFFGDPANLAPELVSDDWASRIRRAGFDWEVRGPSNSRNVDYSDVDAVVAVRSFQKTGFFRKPASKLINAWIAGVPAVCGREFAFREAGYPEESYLEARTCKQLCDQLARLRSDPSLGARLVAGGARAVGPYRREAVLRNWQDVLALARKAREKKAARGRGAEIGKRIRTKAVSVHRRVMKAAGSDHNAF